MSQFDVDIGSISGGLARAAMASIQVILAFHVFQPSFSTPLNYVKEGTIVLSRRRIEKSEKNELNGLCCK